jgi:hypothetical protein
MYNGTFVIGIRPPGAQVEIIKSSASPFRVFESKIMDAIAPGPEPNRSSVVARLMLRRRSGQAQLAGQGGR